ncbi:unnamed protein product [Acanthosepion pharaonis]|uniref:Uncharacterized protein n=1 Tax=Acanthosepion pharaonis TaxID=158019 RepID=A0A812DGN8_ACAPH|nr:unnamed protein product [Sepia pharaonis]
MSFSYIEIFYFALLYSRKIVDGDDESNGVTAAVAITSTVVPLVIIIIVVLVTISFRSLTCRQYYQAAYNYLAVPSHSQSSPPTVIPVPETYEEADFPSIPVSDFIAHVELLHADSDIGFSQQFDVTNLLSKCPMSLIHFPYFHCSLITTPLFFLQWSRDSIHAFVIDIFTY